MKQKLAIITSGGGMECAYSAGVIFALATKFNLKEPDIVIGGSGSTGTLSYFVSGQYGSIKNIWLNLLSTPRFIDHARFWKIVDVDYLIDKVFKKQDALDYKKIYSSEINYLIATTNYNTGKVEYFSNRTNGKIFECMRASMALPVLYGKIVKINKKNYCDTINSSSMELSILKASSLGAKKIIIIDNEVLTKTEDLCYNLWVSLQSKKFRKNYEKEIKKRDFIKLPKGTKIVYLRPKKKLKIEILDHDQDELKKTFNQGYKETINNNKLRDFLKNIN